MRPLGAPGRYTFAPNQLAAAKWYEPAGRLINGHVEESFGNARNWPELRRFLQETDGAFGINAAEIGYLTSDWLLELRRSGIRLSVETPAWTQCSSGLELARAELFGSLVDGRNIFQSNFRILDADGRSDPVGHGWFFTKDNKHYAPDELVLDHRMLSVLPSFDIDVLLAANPGSSWQARKDAARRDSCSAADSFHLTSVDRVTGVLVDYVDYARVMAQRFPERPAISFHWNVVPQWEWGDERCIDKLHGLHPDNESFASALVHLESPCHRDTAILDRLVGALCQAGVCPATVFMDMDIHYQTGYSLDAMRRNKDVLRKQGIAFGVDLADECNEQTSCIQVVSASGEMRLEHSAVKDVRSINLLDQRSLVNKFQFLVDNNIIDRDTNVRFESWSVRPIEAKDETTEKQEGSFANTVLLLKHEFVIPGGWKRESRP